MEPEITLWQPPPSRLFVPDRELHLWRFKYDMTAADLNSLREILDIEEIARAERLLDRQKKCQFIVARGYLRVILGEYLQINPNQVQFQYNDYGKPSLAGSHYSFLSFNLSHSGHWTLIAVATNNPVGVDLEHIDPAINFSQLSHNYFNQQEKLNLDQYPQSRQRRGFYRLWTQKEAMLKFLGKGFAASSAMSGAVANRLKTFPLSTDYICTVAFDRKIKLIKRFHFSVI